MRDHWKTFQLISPVVIDQNAFILLLWTIYSPSLIQRMLYYLGHDVFMESVSYIKHVVSVTLAPLWILVGEILHHVMESHQLRIQLFHAQLVVFHNLYELDLLQLEQLFLPTKDFLGEVPRKHLVAGHIVLIQS